MEEVSTPRVFFVLPPAKQTTPEEHTLWKDTQKLAEERGWATHVFRAKQVRSQVRSESARPILLLDPWDARKLYRDGHRGFCAAFDFRQVRVLKDPKKLPSTANSVSLRQFVSHKLFYGRLNSVSTVEALLDEFSGWQDLLSCTGERDARCLPHLVFAPDHDASGLGAEAADEAFLKKFGGPGSLLDASGRNWNRPTAAHGQPVLTVGGFSLRAGFHWDVQNSKGTNDMPSIHEVWRFSKGSYANVYPDGTVRSGQTAGISAKNVYQAERPSAAIAAASKPPAPARAVRRKSRQN